MKRSTALAGRITGPSRRRFATLADLAEAELPTSRNAGEGEGRGDRPVRGILQHLATVSQSRAAHDISEEWGFQPRPAWCTRLDGQR
eukprot:13964129-Alexandrium_andersonii.AAC.1